MAPGIYFEFKSDRDEVIQVLEIRSADLIASQHMMSLHPVIANEYGIYIFITTRVVIIDGKRSMDRCLNFSPNDHSIIQDAILQQIDPNYLAPSIPA